MAIKITPLVFEPYEEQVGLKLQNCYRIHDGPSRPISVTLWNDGFESTAYFDLKALKAIRDWCDTAIAAYPDTLRETIRNTNDGAGRIE